MARRKVETDGAGNFKISDTNPNAAAGLPGCACGSWRCKPPFLVFAQRLNAGARPGFVSISLGCAKLGVLQYERGDEIQRVGSARAGEDGPPAVKPEVEGSDNPYFKTGIDSHARPLHVVRAEIDADSLEARLAARQDEVEQAQAVTDGA